MTNELPREHNCECKVNHVSPCTYPAFRVYIRNGETVWLCDHCDFNDDKELVPFNEKDKQTC